MRLKKYYIRIVGLFATGAILLATLGVGTAVSKPAPNKRVDVIIGFNRAPGAFEEALIRANGGKIKAKFKIIPSIAANIPQRALAGLARHPLIDIIEPDVEIHAVDAELDNAWGVKKIGAGIVHEEGTAAAKGANIKVAVIDSGIDYTHPDLNDNYAGGYDFVSNDTDPMDDNDHGTHVAGTIAAEDNGEGVVGVAPEADLYAYKVLSASGSGAYSAVISALDQAITDGIQVTNNSYGSSGDPGVQVRNAFDKAADRGIINIAAAGNSGNVRGNNDTVIYPARYDSVVAVAATYQTDERTYFSSTGPDVELAAPGSGINSTKRGGGYVEYDGTSMASPHAAGTAALIIAAGIKDTSGNNKINDEVRQVLQDTAVDLGTAGRDTFYGYGRIDAAAAVAAVPKPPVVGHVTDIQIASITGPSWTLSGDPALLTVVVANSGNQDVADPITVTVIDDAQAVIGIQVISSGLAAGASTSFEVIWDTTGLSFGNHAVIAGHDQTDDNAANDSKSTTILIADAPPAIHIADIDAVKKVKGKNGWEVLSTFTVHNMDGQPVAGATVNVTASGARNGTGTGTTGSDGKVTFTTGVMKSGTSVTFTVTGAAYGSYTYDAADNTDPDGDSNGTSITVTR